MRRAGPVSQAGSVSRDLDTSVEHTKNQLRNYMEKFQPGQLGSRHRDAGILASRAENLPCHRDCRCHSGFGSPRGFGPPGPDPLADLDPPVQLR